MARLGSFLVVIGILFMVGGGIAFALTQDGYGALGAFSAAQGVELSYNDEGQLVDRGATEGADAIRDLLEDDWGFVITERDLDPDDPLVNTQTEYMYQMAVVGYHTLHGTQTVVLDEDVTYKDVVYAAGSYDFAVDGRYWSDFDRSHPLEGPARAQAWTGTAHALVAELGVGAVTHSALQLALALAGVIFGLGATFAMTGGGLIWVSRES